MRILRLEAENVKRLSAVSIEPTGSLVQITGRNGAGKTSVLDSIWWCIAGASNIQADPIRHGANKARIQLDLGELVVTRTFNRQGDGDGYTTAITVEKADGSRYPSPQRMLDDLLGTLSFDPLHFARAPQKEQFAMLRKFVPDVDFDAIDAENKADFTKRTDVNRRAKEARTLAERIVVPNVAAAPLDATKAIADLAEAHEFNADIEKRRGARLAAKTKAEGLRNTASDYADRAADLRQQAETLELEAAEFRTQAEELERKLAAAGDLPDPIDVTAAAAAIQAAQAAQAAALAARQKREERDRYAAQADALEAESEALTAAMKARDDAKAEAIANAKMPVPGIGFGDGMVLLNNVPFDQGSDAEQLRASVAIAMAANPKLRVIRVRDGSLLDEDGLRLLGEMAEANDYQVWLEKVDSTGTMGFVISDGTVVQKKKPVRAAG